MLSMSVRFFTSKEVSLRKRLPEHILIAIILVVSIKLWMTAGWRYTQSSEHKRYLLSLLLHLMTFLSENSRILVFLWATNADRQEASLGAGIAGI